MILQCFSSTTCEQSDMCRCHDGHFTCKIPSPAPSYATSYMGLGGLFTSEMELFFGRMGAPSPHWWKGSIIPLPMYMYVVCATCIERSTEGRVQHWLISRINSLEATERALLKVHTTELATGSSVH